MGNYINGIGYKKDLKQLEINTDGYPVLSPGYAYIENHEYYIFASGQVAHLSGQGTLSNIPYVPGSSYFLVERLEDLGNIDTTTYLDTEDTELITPPSSGHWEYNDENSMNFIYNIVGDPRYLVYECGTSFTLSTKFVENTNLVVSALPVQEVSDIEIDPVWLSATSIGKPIKFSSKVTDIYSSLVESEQLKWYKVYDILPSGISPSGVLDTIELVGSSTTDENGITLMDIAPNPIEDNLFIYSEKINSQGNEIRSDLDWIQITPSGVASANIFQIDNDLMFWSSREAMTAIGYDDWRELWTVGSLIPGYDEIITGQTTPDPETRGEWKLAFPAYQRPPMGSIYAVNEAEGYYNGEDFHNDYDVTAQGGVVAFVNQQRCAVQGYWGQIMVKGSIIKSGIFDAHILNAADTKYTVYHLDGVGGNVNIWASAGYYGTLGSWDTIRNDLSGIYDNLYYVLYAPGYKNNLTAYFTGNDFYFRGLALMNVNFTSPDYLSQNYYISQLIPNIILSQ